MTINTLKKIGIIALELIVILSMASCAENSTSNVAPAPTKAPEYAFNIGDTVSVTADSLYPTTDFNGESGFRMIPFYPTTQKCTVTYRGWNYANSRDFNSAVLKFYGVQCVGVSGYVSDNSLSAFTGAPPQAAGLELTATAASAASTPPPTSTSTPPPPPPAQGQNDSGCYTSQGMHVTKDTMLGAIKCVGFGWWQNTNPGGGKWYQEPPAGAGQP